MSLVDLATAFAVLAGLVFSGLQLRQFRVARQATTAFELARSFQTPEVAEALTLLMDVPDDVSLEELRGRAGDRFYLVVMLMTTWESLGFLVFRRELPLALAAELFSGPVLLSWRKLHCVVADVRANFQRESLSQWFQWLTEQLAASETGKQLAPAYKRHRAWRR